MEGTRANRGEPPGANEGYLLYRRCSTVLRFQSGQLADGVIGGKSVNLSGTALIAASVLGVLVSSLPNAALPDAPQGLLTFTFDDASRSQYEIGLSHAQEYGIRGTLFVVTRGCDDATQEDAQARAEHEGDSGSDATYQPATWSMTWDEVRLFREAGWEIGSHTHTHPHLPELDDAEIIEEMETALARIKAETGNKAVTFAPPYGDFSQRTLQLAMARHDYHLLGLGHSNGGQNPIDAVDPTQIDRLGVYTHTQVSSICGEMERAAEQQNWLILMFHGFSEGEPGEYEIRADKFRKIMACARELEDIGHIRIATISEAMRLIEGAR